MAGVTVSSILSGSHEWIVKNEKQDIAIKHFVKEYADELKKYPHNVLYNNPDTGSDKGADELWDKGLGYRFLITFDDLDPEASVFQFWCDLISDYDYSAAEIGIGHNAFSKSFYSDLYTLVNDAFGENLEVGFNAALDSDEEGYYNVWLELAKDGGFNVSESTYYTNDAW